MRTFGSPNVRQPIFVHRQAAGAEAEAEAGAEAGAVARAGAAACCAALVAAMAPRPALATALFRSVAPALPPFATTPTLVEVLRSDNNILYFLFHTDHHNVPTKFVEA